MRSAADVTRISTLAAAGCGASEIARATGIPRSTVRDWLRRDRSDAAARCSSCGRPVHAYDRLPEREYAYLLGMYLGDGHISRAHGRCFRLRVTGDADYPGVAAECREAMRAVMPTSRATIRTRPDGAVEISSYANAWPCLLPQHGPGKKHTRRIELAAWQSAIVRRQPQQLLRGLLHSDGCRVLNRVGEKEYPRYFFTQVSADIRDIFCTTCRQLDIPYTVSSAKNVSIARAAAVARLDGFVGPKT
jgi:hypothetical protein